MVPQIKFTDHQFNAVIYFCRLTFIICVQHRICIIASNFHHNLEKQIKNSRDKFIEVQERIFDAIETLR